MGEMQPRMGELTCPMGEIGSAWGDKQKCRGENAMNIYYQIIPRSRLAI